MRKLRSILVLLLLAVVGFNGTAQAHVLRESNGISGVLHMPPADEPRAGELTTMYVSFGDKSNRFNLEHCNCMLEIAKDGKQLAKLQPKPQTAGATLASTATYEFPSIGAYDLILSGKSTDRSFPSFRLPYVVRVATDVQSTATLERKNINSEIFIISGGVLTGIAIFAYAAMRDGKRYSTKPSSKSAIK